MLRRALMRTTPMSRHSVKTVFPNRCGILAPPPPARRHTISVWTPFQKARSCSRSSRQETSSLLLRAEDFVTELTPNTPPDTGVLMQDNFGSHKECISWTYQNNEEFAPMFTYFEICEIDGMPSGHFKTQNIFLHLGTLAFNVLRLINQQMMSHKGHLPPKLNMTRRRLHSVMQDLIYIRLQTGKSCHRGNIEIMQPSDTQHKTKTGRSRGRGDMP